jgi:putative RNA 2'-phosphotransferase
MATLTDKEKIRVSKFMSLVLRHKPEAAGLKLDKDGWAPLHLFLIGVQKEFPNVMLADIKEIVRESDKQRYALDANELRIRATQGHSVKLAGTTVAPATPPDVLYHGTAWANEDSIVAEGLKPMSRIHVHLSVDRETAKKVGSRHGYPVVFAVDAKRAHTDGISFYVADNGVWLADVVPARYLSKATDWEGIAEARERPLVEVMRAVHSATVAQES